MTFDLGLSQAANLAVHAGLLLAEESEDDGGRLTVAEMAESLSVSRAHLAKVLQKLGREGLVESCRGRAGGFRLARSACEVSLMELVEAVDGPSLTGGCLLGDPVCRRGECVLSNLMDEVGDRVVESLSRATLMEFVCSQKE